MSLKLLVAAFCLLAVAQARPPKPPTTSCSVACVSRTFWTGYQVGKVYTYQFEQKVELSSELSSTQASRLQVTGQAKVEVHSDCELALTVEVKDAKVGEIDDADTLTPREPPTKVLEALRLPLRFAFENGQIVHLCPNADETRASLNLKRGLLSQLQVSTEQRGQEHQLEERDVLGDCWTLYTPEGPNTLLKTKDLSKCKLNYQAYPLTGVKTFDDAKIQTKQPITKGSLKCRIEIDAERDFVKETVCTEEQTQSSDNGLEAAKETIRTSTRLILKSEVSGLANALHEVTERTDLRHGHKTSEECHSTTAWAEEDLFHSGNECVEKKSGVKTSAEYKSQAKKTLEELCEDTKSQGVNRDSPQKYADLIKYMRGITEQEDFNQLYKWVRDGYCSENPLLATILRSAIPAVGTKQSVFLILDQLSKSLVEGAHRSNWLMNGIALMQHPTPEILPELLNYVKKSREDSMLSVTRDEPLALSAVVHKICQELPNCETEPKVKAVIDYFSDSLGPACEQFNTDADNAFVALLSVGNMGRVAGGATALVRCAASARLPAVYRAFALHSLRRFPELQTDAQDQLVELMLNAAQDSELRIAAYQALARYGFDKSSRLFQAVRRLLNNADEDRQVQMFVYTHAQNLQGDAARQIESVLRAASQSGELEKLSRRQYSNSLRAEYFSTALGAGAQAEVPIVFSAQSAIPRYIGLNLTVNIPSIGQSVNLMEVGVRMQGLERLVEEIYSRIAKKFDPKAKSSSSQPEASADERQSELTAEQRSSLDQTETEPRIDLLIRSYGAEMSHSDLSGGFLKSIPEIVSKSTDYSVLMKLLAQDSSSRSPIGVSAGTLIENTLSIPTIAGLPILVKREMHYLTNLRMESQIKNSRSSPETTLDLKPAAAVLVSRTLAVDAIFERAGIRSSTSFMTSTALRLSLKKNLADPTDRQFSVKVEPLMKKQSVADAKTEINFFQHTAGRVQTEKPLAPQQGIVKREKCIEGLSKKFSGHKICYKTENLPSCKKSLRSFCQCPGSYQLFLEKSDDFGAYEVSLSLKDQDKIKQIQVVLGDQKSTERLLKFNVQRVIEGDRTNYKLELQNPIFPIVLDSNITKESENFRVYSEMQAGSVEYVASGTLQPQSEKGIKISGEIYPKEKLSQKVTVSLEHQFDGFSPLLLPQASSKLLVRMHTGNQLSLEYKLKHENVNFAWLMSSQYKTSKGDVTSMRYRVQYNKKAEESTESSTFLYDIEMQNPKGNNLAHSLHTKLIRRVEADSRQTTASVNHKLQYGVDKKRSPVDFEARVTLKEAQDGELFRVTGDGELTYLSSGESVTAKLENFKMQIGETADETDGFGKQYLYAASYAIKFEETSAKYEIELRHLNWNRWSLTQQAVELKAKANLGANSYSAQLKHYLNSEKYQTRQIIKLEKYNAVYIHLDHKINKAEGADSIKSEFYLQTPDQSKVRAKWGIAWPDSDRTESDIVIEVNDKKVLGCKQTLRYTSTSRDHQVKHEVTLEMQPSSYTLETNFKIGRQSTQDLTSFLSYQVRLITGRYSVGKSLRLLATLLRDLSLEQSSKLVGPTPNQRAVLENLINVNSDGEVWKNLLQVTIDSKDIIKNGLTISRTRQFSDSPIWTMKEGIKIELISMDQSLKTEIEAGMSKSNRKYSLSLKIASKDTWGWHDIKADVSHLKVTTSRWETAINLEGVMKKKSITSRANITLGTEDATDKSYLIVTVSNPGSKLRVELNQVSSPLQLASSINLDGDFGLFPVKDVKVTADFTTQQGINFESVGEVDGTRVAFAKLQIKDKAFIADLKTAHPYLQEAGIKVVLDADIEEAANCNAIVKFVGLTKRLQIKKTGTVKLSRNSPVYSFLFALTGNVEFEGFEGLISYKNLEYDLMLKKKPGMEYQFVTSISSPDYTSAKLPMLFLSSSLNFWPFKTDLKFKLNNYNGWDVKYGYQAEINYNSAFIGVEFKDQEAGVTYEIQDVADNVKTANLRVKCSFCTENRRDLVVGQANMTWPLKLSEFEFGMDTQINMQTLQRIALRFVHRPASKQILTAFSWDGKTHKLIDGTYTETNIEGGVRGSVLLQCDLRFFLDDKALARVQANYQFGVDKELDYALSWSNRDTKALQGKIFWLTTPRSYETIPVANVDKGFQLKGFGVDAYAVHTTKLDKSGEWRLSATLPALRGPITARLELVDGKVKSGKINAFDRELLLSSNPETGIQVTLRTNTDETKTLRLKWSGKFESLQDMRGKLEIEADGKTSIVEVKVQPQQIVVNYGRSTAPNTLKIEYDASTGASLWDMTADLTISHETDVEKNSELILLPDYKVRVLTTGFPFKLVFSAKSISQISITFEAAGLDVKTLLYKHDFTGFPQSFSAESNLISSDATKKVWEMIIKFDLDTLKAEAMCQVSDWFKLAFKEPKFELQVKSTIELTVQFPKFLTGQDNSDKKELKIKLSLPALKIDEPISLKATLEGRQLKVKYGRGDDDQSIVLSLTSRKFSLTPKFEIDLETSLVSKNALLGSWQIRSLEARLESSKESLTDTDGYAIKIKKSVKVNGDDMHTAIIRLDGEDALLPSKGELTVTGTVECSLKVDLSKKDQQLVKVRFSLDKLGSSRDKYALKFDISPVKANALLPDFKLTTEYPMRQFVISKEFKEKAGEDKVEVQLYLNKRLDQGITIVYKVEAPTTAIPKYTIEIDLPTRKIRAVCQPEIGSKKLGVMTTFDWDADKSTEKILGLDARVDFSSDILAIVEFKAPFLTNRVRIEGRYENKEEGFRVQLKQVNGESEAMKIKAEYSYQRQAENDVARFTLETTGAVESKISFSAQVRDEIEDYRRSKFDGALKIKIYSMERNIKFVYRPMREITVTCDSGAALSIKYTTDNKNLHQLVLFISNNDKSAARLKLTYSRPTRKVTAKFDIGSGSFNHNTDLRGPIYRPETVLLRAEFGCNQNQEVNAAAFVGKMAVGQKLNPEDAAAVPGHLSFFVFGIQFVNNRIKFRINWRTPSRERLGAATDSLMTVLQNFKSTSGVAFVGAFDHVAAVKRSAGAHVNILWIVEEIGSLAANDLDKLTRYIQRALENNEFYLQQIASGANAIGRIATRSLAAAADAATTLTETLSKLKIVEKIVDASQQTWEAVVKLYESIPLENIQKVASEFFEKIATLSRYWYENAAEKLNIYFEWFYGIVSDPSRPRMISKLLQISSEYLENLSPLISGAQGYFVQAWSQARSIVGACMVGAKSLLIDDLLPIAVNHLDDFKTVIQLYDNLMLELRVWYDSGATPEERAALIQTSQLLNYIISDDTMAIFRDLVDGCRLIINGDFANGLKKLYGQYSYTIWRPECDAACQRGESFAAVEGFVYNLNYISPWSAPNIVLRRITSKLARKGLPQVSLVSTIFGSAISPVDQLLGVRHRTAILAGDNQLITFDGVALTHERPCNYLLAREFPRGLFSVIQEYRQLDGRQIRDRLRVRFDTARVFVNRDGAIEINGKVERVGRKALVTILETGKSIEASQEGDILTVRFHSSLRNTLVLRCSSVADSCVISVHPLYQGSVKGLMGSNDGRRSNDIHKKDATEHVKFWTAGQCSAEGSASAGVPDSSSSSSSANDCFAWFRKPKSPLAGCFDAVDPQPYLALCQQHERQGRDPCKATRQYAQRCQTENSWVAIPTKCIACRLDRDNDIAKAGLVTDKATLQKRIQVVFLIENSACGVDAVGSGGSRIRSLAGIIDRLKASNAKVKSIEFGLAHYGGSESTSALTSVPMGEDDDQATSRRFGSREELNAALARMSLTGSADDSASVDVLRAVADLPAHFQWQPLAQKHLIVISCKPCTASSWKYASLFDKAQQSVKDQVYVHTISKTAIRPDQSLTPDYVGYDTEFYHNDDWSSSAMDRLGIADSRRLAAECSAELATEAGSSAQGSVWRLDRLTAGGDKSNQVMQLLVTKEFQRRLDNPGCRQCSCGAEGRVWSPLQPQQQQQQQQQQQPWCRIAKCAV